MEDSLSGHFQSPSRLYRNLRQIQSIGRSVKQNYTNRKKFRLKYRVLVRTVQRLMRKDLRKMEHAKHVREASIQSEERWSSWIFNSITWNTRTQHCRLNLTANSIKNLTLTVLKMTARRIILKVDQSAEILTGLLWTQNYPKFLGRG